MEAGAEKRVVNEKLGWKVYRGEVLVMDFCPEFVGCNLASEVLSAAEPEHFLHFLRSC